MTSCTGRPVSRPWNSMGPSGVSTRVTSTP
jgi:hypothetical protein